MLKRESVKLIKWPKTPKAKYDKEQYIKRAAALSGQVAVIKVGGATETEIDEKSFELMTPLLLPRRLWPKVLFPVVE